jgi:hypothetical protein
MPVFLYSAWDVGHALFHFRAKVSPPPKPGMLTST